MGSAVGRRSSIRGRKRREGPPPSKARVEETFSDHSISLVRSFLEQHLRQCWPFSGLAPGADLDADGNLSLGEVKKMQSFFLADETTRQLTKRMEELEKRVEDNTDKLDHILEILEHSEKK